MLADYPHVPGAKTDTPETSLQAATALRGKAATLRERVLGHLTRGPATADECAAAMEESVLAVRPRFSELVKMGKVADTGTRRRNASGHVAAVWKLAGPTSNKQMDLL